MTTVTGSAAPAALAEPTVTPPARWVLALTLVNLGVTSGWFGSIQVLLAEQAREIAPGNKEGVLSLVRTSASRRTDEGRPAAKSAGRSADSR